MKFLYAVTATLVAAALGAQVVTAQAGSNYTNIPVGDFAPSNLSTDAIGTSLMPISIVPRGSKTYVAGLRSSIDGINYCDAVLIAPTHLITASYCAYSDVRWASIGSHYANGTLDGEQIKINAILNHPESSATNYSHDLAIIQLEKPSSFPPLSIAADADLELKGGEAAVKLGWNSTIGSEDEGYELRREEVTLMTNEECSKEMSVDDSQACARGIANSKCWGYGGPLIVERPSGDELIAVSSYFPGCRRLPYPNIYSRLLSAREWIEKVVGGTCFH